MLVRRRAVVEVAGSVAARNARQSWSFRRGILLVLEDEEGHVGYGEASPLPGWSREELAPARWALEAMPSAFEVEDEIDAIDQVVREIPARLASSRFALETALYDLLARRRGTSVVSLLVPRRSRAPICQLIEDGDRIEAETVKVKAGLLPFSLELDRLRKLRSTIGRDVRLRLDFNGSLPVRRLHESLAQLAELDVELVEEPAPVEALLELGDAPVSLALDESLLTAGELVDDLARLGLIRALVLKPMLLGGARVTLRVAEWAAQIGVAVTVTHAFDGPVAHAMTSAIALALPGELLPVGLWPHAGMHLWGERALPHVDGAWIVEGGSVGLGVGGLS